MDANDIQKILIRLNQLENDLQTRRAVNEERREQHKKEMQRTNERISESHASLGKRLDKIEGGFARVFWVVAALVLGAFVTFLLQGGLTIAV